MCILNAKCYRKVKDIEKFIFQDLKDLHKELLRKYIVYVSTYTGQYKFKTACQKIIKI